MERALDYECKDLVSVPEDLLGLWSHSPDCGPATELFRDPSSAANGFGKNCSYPPGAVNIKELNYSYYDFACRRVWSVGLISSMNSDGLIP